MPYYTRQPSATVITTRLGVCRPCYNSAAARMLGRSRHPNPHKTLGEHSRKYTFIWKAAVRVLRHIMVLFDRL